jgi:small subunit ribosomal protein S17
MKIFVGKVTSTKMQKTATVEVVRVVVHRVYKKRYWVSRKYHVHDEIGVSVGDRVKFVASRPYSKLKKWKVLEIVKDKGKKKTVGSKSTGKKRKSLKNSNKKT